MSWDTAIQLFILLILFILSKFMASRVGDFVHRPAPGEWEAELRLARNPITGE